jgi:hypothetical protein
MFMSVRKRVVGGACITGLVLTLYFWNRRRVAAAQVQERRYYNGRTTPPRNGS